MGNPPWKELKSEELAEDDKPAWEWMKKYKNEFPVGGYQLAEAFAWRSAQVMNENGVSALLLPAMTLFKYESTNFRRSFLAKHALWSVANFADLAETLFAGRSRLPAAAFFSAGVPPAPDHVIETFSPLAANQLTNVPSRANQRQDEWNIIVNSSDLSCIDLRDVIDGSSLWWKIAMWGSMTDLRVLRGTTKRFPTLKDLETKGEILVSQGMELRPNGTRDTEQYDKLADKATLTVTPLKRRRFLWQFPKEAITKIAKEHVAVRKGRYSLPSQVSLPPHLIIGASRNFAVYSEQYLVVPARQIGIASPVGHHSLLRALALYLNSDFVAYHQFLTTTQAGIQKSISTLKALRDLPIPFAASSDLSAWEQLYQRITEECRDRDDFNIPKLVRALNDLTFESLKLSARGRAAVDDLVQRTVRPDAWQTSSRSDRETHS